MRATRHASLPVGLHSPNSAQDLAIEELVELAASIRLAGEEGARIRSSLAAKAAALRGRQMAAIEADAHSASERMGFPTVGMFVGFLALLAYPAVATDRRLVSSTPFPSSTHLRRRPWTPSCRSGSTPSPASRWSDDERGEVSATTVIWAAALVVVALGVGAPRQQDPGEGRLDQLLMPSPGSLIVGVSERGEATTQFVILVPVLFALALIVVQSALWFHAANVASAAAADGAAAGSRADSTAGQATDAAAVTLNELGARSALSTPAVATTATDIEVSVTVAVSQIVPFFPDSVTRHATEPRVPYPSPTDDSSFPISSPTDTE